MEAARAKIKRLADNYVIKQQELLAEILPQDVGACCLAACPCCPSTIPSLFQHAGPRYQ